MTGPLHLLSAGAARGLATALRSAFETATGRRVEAQFGAAGAMREQLRAGAPCDVIVLPAKMMDRLAVEGDVQSAGIAPLGRVRTGVAVRADDPRPKVGDPTALAVALRAAQGIYFPDPALATAGIHFMTVLDRLGLQQAVAPALRPHPSGADAMAAMARATDGLVIGCTQVTEILYTPGVALVAPLPAAFELCTIYVAAVATRSGEPGLARRYVESLAGDEAAALRAAAGFER